MSASRRRTVIVLVAALGVAVMLVLAAATGPGRMVGELPTSETTEPTTRGRRTHPQTPPKAAPTSSPSTTTATDLGDWLQDLFYLALLLLGLWLAAGWCA